MYFNNNKKNTNIDKEFKDSNNILSTFLNFLQKYKIYITIGIVILLIIIMILLFTGRNNNKNQTYLTLSGDEIITIYKDSDYIEPGYRAYNKKNEDLTKNVDISTNLNINQVGEYQITYKIDNITKIRTIKIIEKNENIQENTYIYLNTVNNNVNIYLKLGETYTEPGYKVYNSQGKDLNDTVKITGNIDTNKKGIYQLIYSLVDSNNVTISATRNIIVMDTDINLSLKNNEYTNDTVYIDINIVDQYFDYLILPDGTKVTNNTYTYNVSKNGTYKFTTYNKKGMTKEASIEVKTIDKKAPTGSCTIDENSQGSIIKITSSDESGIAKYIYNQQTYTKNTINLSKIIKSADITIYDKAGNTKNISCKVVPKVYIENIKQDGVIITVSAKKISSEISGYYFSYTNKRPDKNGGYIKTNKESIDIVRLPGTTYVWVEDTSGKISEAKTITLSNDVLFYTTGSEYTILKNIQFSTYLSNHGWSLEEYNNLIARSARAAGLYTKDAVATSAVALSTVLAQKYKIKMQYYYSGKSWSFGASQYWGIDHSIKVNGILPFPGIDCSGFVTWAYVNAGYKIPKWDYPHDYYWGRFSGMTGSIKRKDGVPGDLLVIGGHVKIIIAKTSTGYITAEEKGTKYGMIVNEHLYSEPNGYTVTLMDKFMNTYGKYSESSYPSGF